MSDNTTAVASINHMGTNHSVENNEETWKLWTWCIDQKIWISAAHVPGKHSVVADRESRHRNLDSEWQLNCHDLTRALELLNFEPHVDLFASTRNAQYEDFVSFQPETNALAVDAFSLNWKHLQFYAFPPLQLDCTGATEGDGRLCHRNFAGAGLADTDVVPFGSPAFMQTTHPPSLQEGPPSPPRLTRNDSSTAFAEETGPAGLQSLRTRFEATGLNDDAIHLVMNSWRPNTAKSYSTYIKKWLDYIAANNIQDITIATFANFLSTLYIHGNGYSTINLARSAVAASLAPDGFVGFGTHPIITKLLRGVFHKRPALPKYTSTWNVDVMIKFLSEWPDLNVMTLKQLTLRLVMLLCLLSGQRGETIYKIRVNDISFHDNNCFIVFSSLLKTSNPRRHLQPLELRYFTNERLCVVSHLQHYLAVTQDIRLGDQLFLTYIKPHRPIARGTLSRWIKMILKMAGVNTEVYSAHSTRVVSTSAAMVRNVPLDVILRSAGWSKKSTFEKFYFRNIPSCEPNFTDNVSGACFACCVALVPHWLKSHGNILPQG
ncbi:reverse transcriptase/ribonuclease h/methyltransferase [Plakobranchus ocellatus]|uniref:Reverse transcriptase/ribonuclease h/methyltransferase n=1 Tax=Plakobranchus ocellatus TaxID=259542 RepID=A0AAV3Y2N5_9GAST|nr:reverse transcriptase/ribonuclease h/methyltransferase [Plakobranchus ocellatus]